MERTQSSKRYALTVSICPVEYPVSGMNDCSKRTDAELFAMFSSSEPEKARCALEEAYTRYSNRIYAYCRRILGDDHAAADMLQESFMRYYEQGKNGKEVQNHASYLFKIARNLCYSHKAVAQRNSDSIEEHHTPFRDTPYEQKELMELIRLALEEVPLDLREAFLLREYNGLSYLEIAEVIGESVDVVKVRIFRAKKKIRDILRSYVEELQ